MQTDYEKYFSLIAEDDIELSLASDLTLSQKLDLAWQVYNSKENKYAELAFKFLIEQFQIPEQNKLQQLIEIESLMSLKTSEYVVIYPFEKLNLITDGDLLTEYFFTGVNSDFTDLNALIEKYIVI